MWRYEKRLQYPVNIKQTNPKMAKFIMSQYGGPDGGGDKIISYIIVKIKRTFSSVKFSLIKKSSQQMVFFQVRHKRIKQKVRRQTAAGHLF